MDKDKKAKRRKKIWNSLLTIQIALFISLIGLSYIQEKQTELLIFQNDLAIEEYERIITNQETLLNEYAESYATLEQAFNTSMSENALVSTLLAKGMDEWTADDVLTARARFDKIPYGSPFESGHYITAPFGSMELVGDYWNYNGHKGVDLRPMDNNNNAIVNAVMDGYILEWSRDDPVYGNWLSIVSADGQYMIKYAHLSSIAVHYDDGTYTLRENLYFRRGQRIAKMGNTGKTTGPHLHCEYYEKNPDSSWRLLDASAIIGYIGE